MTYKTCLSFEYKILTPQDKVVSVTLFNEKIDVKGCQDALRAVCTKLISLNRLTPNHVKRFGFSWLALNPDYLILPLQLPRGIFLSTDGSRLTFLVRMDVLLKRLMVPPTSCAYTFVSGESQEGEFSGEKEAAKYLDDWDESQDEPEGCVQKRLHEFGVDDLLTLKPYKMGIGGKKYAVCTWADVFNTLLAYVYLYYGKNGATRLLALQHSSVWKHGAIIKNDDTALRLLPIDEKLGAKKIFDAVVDLISGIGIDRYSVYIKCVVGDASTNVRDAEAPCTNESPDEENREAESEDGSSFQSPTVGESVAEKIEFGTWRHLCPKVILR